ncbi:LysR substrate-binding domain-containing protein [Oceanicella actignis]|uniref:DNA-binding transcriptional regulator, LysR family n=1 Tax=Oceanicella actignis TaxID=1189325 RepID=A0A1M7SSY9_9RHOB|nr:LysR substrate-binding domain-containing protein [Oceanicella actignis]SES69095.1 DNA-binding transcriptional regulator, LysR family [Oceanicella actignis]SHN61484.1 DNA-binding transcriptional regulator, LysR family [Oceanicella actignis]
MTNLRRLLPSPGHLIVFEAAGRLGSFTAAGRELGMSQAAVSLAVRALEDQLGAQLFVRTPRRARLTDAGARFFAEVSQALSQIRGGVEALRAREDGPVTLAVSTAFAAFWMMPRLQQLREALPGVDLRLQTADRDLDLVAEGVPLGVRGGDPADWPGHGAEPIAEEVIFPVASPAWIARHGLPADPAELARRRLIHLEEPTRPAADWGDWFRAAGLEGAAPARELVINDYVLVIQAALEGQGVALGWRHLVERHLRAGLLRRLGGPALRTGRSFHVVWPQGVALTPKARAVRDWLAAAAAEGRRAGAPRLRRRSAPRTPPSAPTTRS